MKFLRKISKKQEQELMWNRSVDSIYTNLIIPSYQNKNQRTR